MNRSYSLKQVWLSQKTPFTLNNILFQAVSFTFVKYVNEMRLVIHLIRFIKLY